MELFSFDSVDIEEEVEESNTSLGMPNILKALDKREFGYYDNFGKSDDERNKNWDKEAYPAFRWYSCVGNPDWAAWKRNGSKGPPPLSDNDYTDYYLIAVNDIINNYFWELKKHPKLLFLLMCFVGMGIQQNHNWPPMVSSKRTKNIFEELLLKLYPSANIMELKILSAKYGSSESIIDLGQKFGLSDEEISKILEYKFGIKNESAKNKEKAKRKAKRK